MFSKELENLIQATLEDGILEPYEKEALVKRAKAEGVDLTELEIYINSILQKRKKEHDEKEEARQEQIDRDKRAAFGRICPNCGKQVPPMTLKCECGYEFNQDATTERAAEILSEKIDDIKGKELRLSPNSENYNKAMDEYARITCELIRNAPIPSTKEDVIDFLALSLSNSKKKGGILGTSKGRFQLVGGMSLAIYIFWMIMFASSGDVNFLGCAILGFLFTLPIIIVGTVLSVKKGRTMLRENKIAEAWEAKFSQVLIKGRSLRGDQDFTRQLDYYESQKNA